MNRRLWAALTASLIAVSAPNAASSYYDADSAACARLRAVARQVGWPVSELREVGRIAARESLCSNAAWNKADPYTGSYCALQLNGSNKRFLIDRRVIKTDMQELRANLRTCLRGGLELWKRHGWVPWRGQSNTPTS